MSLSGVAVQLLAEEEADAAERPLTVEGEVTVLMRPPTPYWRVVAVHMTRFGSVTPRSGSGCQSG